MLKYSIGRSLFGILVLAGLLVPQPAAAELRFSVDKFTDGATYIVVAGEFDFDQSLDEFVRLVRAHNPRLVTFSSNGGNPFKGMELGRLIRRYELSTFQLRGLQCASACALAFIGGTRRAAEPGAIGIHKATISGDARMTPAEAAAKIQSLTAITVDYIKEMGVDPELLHLSFKYEADDVRYLSKSEMAQLRVTNVDVPLTAATPASPSASGTYSNVPPSPRALEQNPYAIPSALTGKLRHPRGGIALKSSPDEKAADLRSIVNGTSVTIISNENFWYGVRTPVGTGYLHHTWVMIDQFERGAFDDRYVQIKSFSSYDNAQEYVRALPFRAAVYLSTTGWFAVVLPGRYSPERAGELLTALKSSRNIPDDSFITYGNSYARRVCCN